MFDIDREEKDSERRPFIVEKKKEIMSIDANNSVNILDTLGLFLFIRDFFNFKSIQLEVQQIKDVEKSPTE